MILDRGRWPDLASLLDSIRSLGLTGPEELTSFLMEDPDVTASSKDDPVIGIPVGGLRIRSVFIDGFGPYRDEIRLDLHDGLTLVTGANGSGKTTILKAIHWCLFGDIGIADPWNSDIDPSGKNIVNWDRRGDGNDRASVEVVLDIGGDTYRSRRFLDRGEMEHHIIGIDRDGSERETNLPPGLSLQIMPFLIFQGESILFLSHEDPFSGEGPIRRALMSLNGGSELMDILRIIDGGRRNLITDLDRLTSLSSPLIERRISHMGKLEAIDEEIYSLEADLKRTDDEIKKTSSEYRKSLADISKLGSADKDMGSLARRVSALGPTVESIKGYLDNAGREILRGMTEKALDRTLAEKESRLQSKLLYGAYEAQAEIVSEVMNRKRCICGMEIGTTGMGRDNLEALHNKIIAKRRSVEDWGEDIPWTSNHTLEQTRRALAREPYHRRNYMDTVNALRDARDAERELEKGPANRAGLIESYMKVIRRYGGLKAKAGTGRKSLTTLRRKRKNAEKTLEGLEGELIKLWGGSKGSDTYREAISYLDLCKLQAEESIQHILRSSRERLQDEINTILPILDPGENYAGCLIHEETFGLGRIRSDDDDVVISMNHMSAGERELLALAAIFAMNRMSGGSLIIDSPFPFMDDERRGRTVKGLTDLIDCGYMSVPTGYLSTDDIASLEMEFAGRGFNHIRIERSGGTSTIEILPKKDTVTDHSWEVD